MHFLALNFSMIETNFLKFMAPTTRKHIHIIVIKHSIALQKCLLWRVHSVLKGFVPPQGRICQVVSLMLGVSHMIENLNHMSLLMLIALLDT